MSNKDIFDELEKWLSEGEPPLSAQRVQPIAGSAMYSTPLEVEQPGALGARTAGHVILNTGQLSYKESLIEIAAHLPIELSLHYISGAANRGPFGHQWYFEYESYFEKFSAGEHTVYRLYLSDGRRFDFPFDKATNTIKDTSGLGVTISWNQQGFFELQYFNGEKARYQNGVLISRIDRNGNYTGLNYDDKGRLEQINHNGELRLSLVYNARNCVTQITDHSGRCWEFAYNAVDMLEEIALPDKGKRHYSYTYAKVPGNIASDTDGTATVNSAGNCLLNKVRNALQQPLLEVRYTKDEKVAMQREKGMIRVSSAQKQQTHYHLDKSGLIDSILYPDEGITAQQWNGEKRCALITHRSGGTETKHFDTQNRLLTHSNSEGKKTVYRYRGNNPFAECIKSVSGKTLNTFDERYNRLSTTDEKDRTEHYSYNGAGDIIQFTDVLGHSRQREYNKAGQLIQEKNADGGITKIVYDLQGRQVQVIDAQGREVQFGYDPCDRITHISDALDHTTTYHYDNAGQLIKLSDPAGHSVHYAYNSQGLLVSENRGAQQIKKIHYSETGLPLQIMREDASVIEHRYDKNARLCKEIIGDQVTDYELDPEGRLLTARTADSLIALSYGEEDQILSQQQNGVQIDSVSARSAR